MPAFYAQPLALISGHVFVLVAMRPSPLSTRSAACIEHPRTVPTRPQRTWVLSQAAARCFARPLPGSHSRPLPGDLLSPLVRPPALPRHWAHPCRRRRRRRFSRPLHGVPVLNPQSCCCHRDISQACQASTMSVVVQEAVVPAGTARWGGPCALVGGVGDGAAAWCQPSCSCIHVVALRT